MPTSMKVLGQVAPGASADTTLYTVPADADVVVSTLTVCNRAGSSTTFRVAVRPNGVALANVHYLYYDATIGPNATVAITIGMTLSDGDVVSVRGGSANLSFSLFGTETTP